MGFWGFGVLGFWGFGAAHDVVEEHVRGPGRRGGGHRPDDGVGCERGLELVRLQPAVEDGAGRAGPGSRGRAARPSRAAGSATPVRASRNRSPGLPENGSGGVSARVGSMTRAIRSSMASYAGRRRASRAENFDTSRRFRSGSGPMSSDRPSGSGVRD